MKSLVALLLLGLVACAPPESFARYTAQDVVQAFNAAGLHTDPLTDINLHDYYPSAPVTPKEAKNFINPNPYTYSGLYAAHILIFQNEADLKAMHDYLNARIQGTSTTQTIVHGNALVVLFRSPMTPQVNMSDYTAAFLSMK